MLVALATTMAACTYGPEERSATVSQIVRLGDSYRALVVVRHDTYRRPTGLNTFPDGGKWKYTQRGAAEYLVDARTLDVQRLARQAAADDVWESFSAWIVGLEADTVGYLRLTGCPRDGECYPGLDREALYRLTTSGGVDSIASVPPGVGLPGEMAARRPGERSYVRFSTSRDTVTARFEEGEPAQRLFVAGLDGSLSVLGR